MVGTIAREQLHTVQLVQITAFDADGRIAHDTMSKHAAHLFEAGIRVFIPCAASSEFHSLVADEIVATVANLRKTLGPEPVIMVPVGLQPAYAAEVGQRSLDAGADAALVMPLSFPYLSDEGARDYYATLMDQLQCPTLIYKKDPLPSDHLLLELADHPALIGIKYAVNDINGFNRILQADGGRIDWFCGSAERFAPFFCLAGSPGYTSGAGNLCPRLTLAMHAAISAGEWQEAMRLQNILLPIEHYRDRSGGSYNVSVLKYAMHHVGLNFGQPRPPFRRLTNAEEREIDEMMTPIMAAEAELSGALAR
jgi:4-hydroxy-tetrahydrodipicolinate synthase